VEIWQQTQTVMLDFVNHNNEKYFVTHASSIADVFGRYQQLLLSIFR